jgi:hypothetical protein
MDKLTKAREELCKDCQLGIHIEQCSKCLFNVLNNEWTREIKERK